MALGVPVSLHGGHTTVFDGASSAAEMVAAADAAGMEVFGLSEHFYRPRDERLLYDERDRERDWGRTGWPAFAADVVALKAQHAGRMTVLLGAEVDYIKGYREWTQRQLGRWPLDFVVVSVHFVSQGEDFYPFDFSDVDWSRAAAVFGGPVGLFRAYYDHVLAALDWGVGHVLGHLDVIKLFAPAAVDDAGVDDRIGEVLERCAATGVVLDLNARGLLKPCAEVYPSRRILERARAAGVEIVPGDDSHAPEQVGLGLEAALDHARAAGYRRISLPSSLGGRTWPL